MPIVRKVVVKPTGTAPVPRVTAEPVLPSRTMTLTFSTVESFIRNPKMQQLFPFVRHAAKRWDKPSGKRVCCGKRGDYSHRENLANMVREAIATLTPDKQQTVKQVLNVDKIIVYFSRPDGSQVRKDI